MGAVPHKVLKWLHGVLTSEYRNVDRTYSDVAHTLTYNHNFSPRTDVYTYENGGSSLLLNLQGTLPVSFRGTTYAFPISIWIPQDYPSSGPMSFVTPTKDMVVRPGQYVSGEGRIYHPYLAGWRGDRSNLSQFLAILQDVFAREPPVIARQEQVPMQTRTLQQNGVPPPIPPLPPELRRAELGTEYYQPTPGQHPPPPPPPPKPFDPRVQTNLQNSGPPPLPPLPIRSGPQYGSAGLGSQTGSTGALQPLARQPPQKGSTLQNNNSGSFQANQASYDLNQQSRREPISPISPVTTSDRQNSFPQGAIHHDQSRYSQQGQPPPSAGHPTVNSTIYQGGNRSSPYQVNRQQPAPQPYQLQQYSQKPLAQQPNPKPPQDLLSSPFEATLPAQPINAAPPPIPPNPQKDALLSALSQSLTQQINSTHASNLSALPPLRAQQSALTSTLNAVNTELSRLNDLENLLSSNEAILHQAMRDADKVLEDAKRRKVPNVDEVLVAPTVAAGQLYECVAEERAVEECRAVLVKALDKGRIGGGVWAKQTRSLAREEFLKKALVKKISKGMGLVEEERWG